MRVRVGVKGEVEVRLGHHRLEGRYQYIVWRIYI